MWIQNITNLELLVLLVNDFPVELKRESEVLKYPVVSIYNFVYLQIVTMSSKSRKQVESTALYLLFKMLSLEYKFYLYLSFDI